MPELAVLLMAYGSPSSESDLEAYLAGIRGGRRPPQKAVDSLRERYRKIGGHSPLLEITNAQASALQKALNSLGLSAHVYAGMKHWHPYIREVVPQIIKHGHRHLVALVLAPHYSQISTGGYRQALDEALANARNLRMDFIESWYDNPLFHQAVAERVGQALGQFPESGKVEVLFTAHSLPERILQQNDPYPSQLRSSCEAVANRANLRHWSFAYQSAGETGEKWLGPDILEALREIKTQGNFSNVLVVPIGFVADHLEILYDIDVEAGEFCREQGLSLKRTKLLNTSPTFIAALAAIVSNRANKKL